MKKPGFIGAILDQAPKPYLPSPLSAAASAKADGGEGQGEGGRRLGDKVHAVLGPIGAAIRWPCLKGDGSTNLKPGSPCDKTRQALNKL